MRKHLLRSNFKKIVILTTLFVIAQSVFTYNFGPGAGYANAPGGSNCTSCHNTYPLITSGTKWTGTTLTTTTSLSSLAPNTTYAMSLTFSSSTSTQYGFEVCVLPTGASATTASLGTLVITNSTLTQLVSATGPARSYVEHTYSGTSAPTHTKTWNFNWTSPTAFYGGVTFYVVINEANTDYQQTGDYVYAKTFGANVLPVKWLDFRAVSMDHQVQLNWSTAVELNNDYYEIERSDDGIEFEAIGKMKGNGNTQKTSYYNFYDTAPLQGKTFYRIKQVDIDGKSDYSKVIQANPAKLADPIVLYTPGAGEIEINCNSYINSIKIFGLNGALVQTAENKGGNKFSLDKMPEGIYLIEVNESGNQWFKKLVFQ